MKIPALFFALIILCLIGLYFYISTITELQTTYYIGEGITALVILALTSAYIKIT